MAKTSLCFLINQSFIYHVDETRLVDLDSDAEQKEIKLDNLESQVLKEFCRHPNQLLSYDDLLALWLPSVVTDSALTRVISKLRKKLKQMGCGNDIIGNIVKKGYKFNTDVRIYQPQFINLAVNEPSATATKNLEPKLLLKGTFFTTLLIAVAGMLLYYLSDSPPYLSLKNTSELISDDSRKRGLILDRAEQRLLFAYTRAQSKQWQLRVIEQATGKVFDFEEDNVDLLNPVWLNDNEIAYRSFNSTSCSIKKVAITAAGFAGKPSVLFDCNPQTTGPSIAALDEQHLLFTNAPVGRAPAHLYQGNVISGEIEPITLNKGTGVGIYKVVTSPKDQTVAIVSSTDWDNHQISLLKKNQHWQSFWQTTTKALIYSVGWNGNELSYRNDMGGFTLVSFDNNEQVNQQDLSLFSPSYAIANHNQKVAFIEGDLYARNIKYYNGLTGESIGITNGGNHKNSLPKFVNRHQILFISDRLGINQLWLHDTNTASSRQISQFKRQQRIENIALDPVSKLIALEIDNTVMLYSYRDQFSQLALIEQFDGDNPSFYQGHLVLSQSDNNSYRLNFYDPGKGTLSDNYISGGNQAYAFDNNLYYTKYSMPGIWRYSATGEDQYITHIDNNAELVSVTKDKLMYKDKQGKLFSYDINSSINQLVNNNYCQDSSDYQYDICLTTEIKPSNTRILISEWNRH